MTPETIQLAIKIAQAMQDTTPATPAKPTEQTETPVVVWTDKRGVIFGYTSDPHARPITLRNARMCLYWSCAVGGVFGLCDRGPDKKSKISATLPSADFEGVTGVARVAKDAEAAWLSAPVQGRNDD
jgi:hypothetical protein